MDNEFRAVVVSFRFECVRNFRSLTRYAPFYGMRTSERTIGRRMAQTSTTDQQPKLLVGACLVPGQPTRSVGTARKTL